MAHERLAAASGHGPSPLKQCRRRTGDRITRLHLPSFRDNEKGPFRLLLTRLLGIAAARGLLFFSVR